jgi:pyridoxal phosphate enzyme (YggS family)
VNADAGAFSGLSERLSHVRERVARAAERAGRDPSDVTLVAVSKAKPIEAVEAALAAGATDLGESRVQELTEKLPTIRGRARIHFIGHLQRNKARKATAACDLIHAVDTAPLVAAIDRHAKELGKRQSVLLEVNTSGDESKYGIAPEALPTLVAAAVKCENVEVRGLMTIGPLGGGSEGARRSFRTLASLLDRLREAGVREPYELSMGMSNDFETAIEEGSTLVRVGSAIFGERFG